MMVTSRNVFVGVLSQNSAREMVAKQLSIDPLHIVTLEPLEAPTSSAPAGGTALDA
jgi:hypothetical protein